MSARIQLVHPPTLFNPTSLQTARPTAPLGLAYIAAALRQAGHVCTILDAIGAAPTQTLENGAAAGIVRLGLSNEEILARIDPDADAIGVTCMFSFNWPFLRDLLHEIRARHPDKIIICGGEHFSALPEMCMQTAPIDYVVVGEGEEIAVELFGKLPGGSFDPAGIKGICWRRGDEIILNPRAERTRAVDQIPWPAWDLFDLESYNEHNLTGGLDFGKTVPIMATRGCPYQCTYCSSAQMWTTRWYTREPTDVADEIQFYVERYNARNFPFHDLTMIVKRDWIIQFCNEIIRRKLDIAWQLPSGTRCEVVDSEVADLLRQSGCRWLGYAPESGSERTRDLIKKRMKTESLLNAVDASVRGKLHISTFMVLGFPHDTRDDLRQTAGVIRRLARKGVEDIAIHFFFPIPSTELFRYLEGHGRIRPDDEGLAAPLFGMRTYLDDRLNYCENMSARELTLWKYWILANFYLTAWITHPTRVARIAYNALRGKQTSTFEKFLGEQMRNLVGRLRPGPKVRFGRIVKADRTGMTPPAVGD